LRELKKSAFTANPISTAKTITPMGMLKTSFFTNTYTMKPIPKENLIPQEIF
jgi:hypothetical protein